MEAAILTAPAVMALLLDARSEAGKEGGVEGLRDIKRLALEYSSPPWRKMGITGGFVIAHCIQPLGIDTDFSIVKGIAIPVVCRGIFDSPLLVWEFQVGNGKRPFVKLENSGLTICSDRSPLIKLLVMFVVHPGGLGSLTFVPMG